MTLGVNQGAELHILKGNLPQSGKTSPKFQINSRFPNIETSKTPLIFSDFEGLKKKIPTKTPPGQHLRNPVLHLAHDIPWNRLVLAFFCDTKRQLHQQWPTKTSFLRNKKFNVQNMSDLKVLKCPPKNTKNPQKRRTKRPHLKGFHVHHVERIVRFISVGEGANWPGRGQGHAPQNIMPDPPEVFSSQRPWKVTKKKKQKEAKPDHLEKPNNHPFFRGDVFQLSGGIPGKSAHPREKKNRPSHVVSISGNLDPLFSLALRNVNPHVSKKSIAPFWLVTENKCLYINPGNGKPKKYNTVLP